MSTNKKEIVSKLTAQITESSKKIFDKAVADIYKNIIDIIAKNREDINKTLPISYKDWTELDHNEHKINLYTYLEDILESEKILSDNN